MIRVNFSLTLTLKPPLLEQTIPEHFASIVSRFGDNTAVVSRAQGRRLTYDKLDHDSNKLARGLRELGVRKGDRVAVSLGNNLEYAVVSSVAGKACKKSQANHAFEEDDLCIVQTWCDLGMTAA